MQEEVKKAQKNRMKILNSVFTKRINTKKNLDMLSGVFLRLLLFFVAFSLAVLYPQKVSTCVYDASQQPTMS